MPRGLPTANSVPGLTACVTMIPLPLPAIQTQVPSDQIAHLQMALGKQSTLQQNYQASQLHGCTLVTFPQDQDSRTLSIANHIVSYDILYIDIVYTKVIQYSVVTVCSRHVTGMCVLAAWFNRWRLLCLSTHTRYVSESFADSCNWSRRVLVRIYQECWWPSVAQRSLPWFYASQTVGQDKILEGQMGPRTVASSPQHWPTPLW